MNNDNQNNIDVNEINNSLNINPTNQENIMQQPEVNQSNNVQNNNEPTKQKKKKGPIIFIVILILIIIALSTFIYLKKDVLFNNNVTNNETNNNNGSQNNESNNNIESKEEVLTDTKLVNEITKKANKIAVDRSNYYVEDGGNYGFFDFDSLYSKLNLTDDDKMLLTLISIPAKKVSIETNKIGNNEFKKIKEMYDSTDSQFAQISYETIEKEYFNLFGTSIPKSALKDYDTCPNYYYDSANNVYFLYIACGGISLDENVTYVNKITKKDDNIYAYISVGRIFGEEKTSNPGSYDMVLYGDYAKKNKLEILENSIYSINSSNYDKFSEYKMTFNKNGNDYYYQSIERTK